MPLQYILPFTSTVETIITGYFLQRLSGIKTDGGLLSLNNVSGVYST
jgi:hypothetical protein